MKKRKHKRKKRNAHIVLKNTAHCESGTPFDEAIWAMQNMLMPLVCKMMEDYSKVIRQFNKQQEKR